MVPVSVMMVPVNGMTITENAMAVTENAVAVSGGRGMDASDQIIRQRATIAALASTVSNSYDLPRHSECIDSVIAGSYLKETRDWSW